jgi:hypothetical protein
MISPIAALAQQQLRDMQQLQRDFGRHRTPTRMTGGEVARVEETRAPRTPWRRMGNAWYALLGHLGHLHRPT